MRREQQQQQHLSTASDALTHTAHSMSRERFETTSKTEENLDSKKRVLSKNVPDSVVHTVLDFTIESATQNDRHAFGSTLLFNAGDRSGSNLDEQSARPAWRSSRLALLSTRFCLRLDAMDDCTRRSVSSEVAKVYWSMVHRSSPRGSHVARMCCSMVHYARVFASRTCAARASRGASAVRASRAAAPCA